MLNFYKQKIAKEVKGLCGTFNWNKKDDLMTYDGDIETNIPAFTESYGKDLNGKECSKKWDEEEKSGIEEACIIFPHRQPRVVKKKIIRTFPRQFFRNFLKITTAYIRKILTQKVVEQFVKIFTALLKSALLSWTSRECIANVFRLTVPKKI